MTNETAKEISKKVRSLGFSEDKTKELIEDLKGEGVEVGVENIAKYIKTQGVVVKVHIGGGRKEFNVSTKIYGVNESKLGTETKEFVSEHMKKGKITFLPANYEGQIRKIDARLRKKKRELAIGYEDSFMTIPIFKEFKTYFEECAVEYMQLRDKIVAEYDQLVKRFSQLTMVSLKELKTIDCEKEYERIMSYIPDKKYYENSFYINLSVRAFPIMENMDIFETDIRRQIEDGLEEDTINILYEAIGRTLSDAFVAVSSLLVGIDKGSIHHKTIDGVRNSIRRLGLKNIFANKKIEEVKLDMQKILSVQTDIDKVSEIAEYVLAKIYCYAIELNIVKYIDMSKCLLSISELIEIYRDYTGEEIIID